MMEPRSFTVPPSAILGRSRPVKERQLRLAAWRERMARLWQGVRRMGRLGKLLCLAAVVAAVIYLLLLRAIDYNPAEILVRCCVPPPLSRFYTDALNPKMYCTASTPLYCSSTAVERLRSVAAVRIFDRLIGDGFDRHGVREGPTWALRPKTSLREGHCRYNTTTAAKPLVHGYCSVQEGSQLDSFTHRLGSHLGLG